MEIALPAAVGRPIAYAVHVSSIWRTVRTALHALPVSATCYEILASNELRLLIFTRVQIRYYEAPTDNCDLAAKTFYRTVHQFWTFLSVLFVTPHLQSGIVFLKLLFLI